MIAVGKERKTVSGISQRGKSESLIDKGFGLKQSPGLKRGSAVTKEVSLIDF